MPIQRLGGRCAGATCRAEDGTVVFLPCRWHNEDGTIGCNDERGLQFDHIAGGGSEARSKGTDSQLQICYEILRGSSRFQLLCATFHEIKKKVERQAQGARMHRQPARVRRSLQIEGQPVRRVRTLPQNRL